jgi:CTP:phosphocholine cytidylyltransferase-like protein
VRANEVEDDEYVAKWKVGDQIQEVYIITKTAYDTREIEFLKEVDCRTIVKLLHHEITSEKEGIKMLSCVSSSA